MIQAEHVSYTYTPGGVFGKAAVKDVSFTIEDGTFCGLIGHTGSGKTTLVQLLAGLLRPTSGTILVDGLDIGEKKNRQNGFHGKVGLVFQYPEYQLFGETVLEDVMFGPLNMKLSKEEAELRARTALLDTGLDEGLFKKSPFELSGGQKRRVAIAGVLALHPTFLMLDEPTAGLDPVGRDEILKAIYALHKRENMTVLLVSHSMEDMAKYAERIFVMDGGNLSMDASPHAVFSETEALRKMGLGVPEMANVIHALRQKGLPLPEGIYTIEAAKEAILKLWEERKCSEI